MHTFQTLFSILPQPLFGAAEPAVMVPALPASAALASLLADCVACVEYLDASPTGELFFSTPAWLAGPGRIESGREGGSLRSVPAFW